MTELIQLCHNWLHTDALLQANKLVELSIEYLLEDLVRGASYLLTVVTLESVLG